MIQEREQSIAAFALVTQYDFYACTILLIYNNILLHQRLSFFARASTFDKVDGFLNLMSFIESRVDYDYFQLARTNHTT